MVKKVIFNQYCHNFGELKTYSLGPPDCSCTDFVNPSGVGFCKTTYDCASLDDPRCVKKFHTKYVCYVNQPTNCKDVTKSSYSKGRKASAVACEQNKGSGRKLELISKFLNFKCYN